MDTLEALDAQEVVDACEPVDTRGAGRTQKVNALKAVAVDALGAVDSRR